MKRGLGNGIPSINYYYAHNIISLDKESEIHYFLAVVKLCTYLAYMGGVN